MNTDDLNQKALAVLLGEAIKPNDPANLRSIIANHTKLLSKAADQKAKEFHRVAIANAKEKLKSLGEEYVTEKYVKSSGYKDCEACIVKLEDYLTPTSNLAKGIIKEFGQGYADDFKQMAKHVEGIVDLWSDVSMDVEMDMHEDAEELDEAATPGSLAVRKVLSLVKELDADETEQFLYSYAIYLRATGLNFENDSQVKTSTHIRQAADTWKKRSGN